MTFSAKVSLRGAQVAAVCALSVCVPALHAQQADTGIPQMKVTQADTDAAQDAGPGRIHGLASNIPGAKEKLDTLQRQRNATAPSRHSAPWADADSADALTPPYFYSGDVTSGGGPTLQTTEFHAIYVNAPGPVASTWGDPEGFLRNLNKSTFIQITDQYVGVSGGDRYPVGSHAKVKYGTPGTLLYESDIEAIVHAVAAQRGAGGGNVYHVFLPPGTDTCISPPTTQNPVPECYSPDNPTTFVFCGYHDAVEFSDIGIALFTVQPWQGAGSGCEIASPAPNGVLIDSTDNVLSHETFETITDPLPGLGYSNNSGSVMTGDEIADECILFNLTTAPGAYTPPIVSINGKKYAVQLEYANKYHGCVSQP